jgi:hypothetical protein
MRVILKENTYSFSKKTVGKKVIATYDEVADIYRVPAYELARIGVERWVLPFNLSKAYVFWKEEVEVVKPKFQNCSDSNVGKGVIDGKGR